MIPILCENNTKKVGFLKDSIKAEVTEERNGIYELVMEYPVSGQYYQDITVDRYVKAKPNMISKNQYFRIYEISKPINGIVTVKGEHISYAMSHYPVDNINLSNVTAQVAVNSVLSRSSALLQEPHSFKVGTCDIDTLTTFKARACSARAALGGIEGSVLDIYGGEFEFDNFTVNLYKSRGSDNGVQIKYGKNMTDLKFDISIQNTYTGIYPYCIGEEDELITLDEGAIHVENKSGIEERILILDLSSAFANDEAKSPENLRKHTEEYLSANDINAIEGSMKVSMIDLSQTENYKGVAVLETVSLCDTVHVKHSILAVTVTLKAVKITYDVLGEKNKSIELGSAKSNFADTIKQLTKTTNKAKEVAERTKSQLVEEYKQAIEDATAAITGYSGGYVRLNPSENPSEILILEDSPDIETAKKIWRFNSAGLAYSSDGYDGPYGPALLAGGKFVINDVTAQTISANLIRAGMLTSADGKTYFNLDGNEIVTSLDTSETKISSGTITQTFKNKFKKFLSTTAITENGIKTHYATDTVQKLNTDSTQSVGFERRIIDADDTMISVVREDATKHSYHSTIETAKDRVATDTSAPSSQKQLFAGFRHYRYVDNVQYNVALGLGITDSYPSTVLELKDNTGVIKARVDFFGTNAIGELRFKGYSQGSYTTAVALGSDFLDLPSGRSYNLKGESVIYKDANGDNVVGRTSRILYLHGSKVAVKKKLYCMDGFSQDPNEFSTYSVISSETIEEIPADISELFTVTDIHIHPKTLTTYSTGEKTLLDENGEMTVIPAEEITETKESYMSFENGNIPSIIRGDEQSVDIFGMAFLEWKAIKDLYQKHKELLEEFSTLKEKAGG
jgi:phage minor structural protein